jgi:hypothetical protein
MIVGPRKRANGCCEYCQTPQAADAAAFQIDHIIARKHVGTTVASKPTASETRPSRDRSAPTFERLAAVSR